MKIDIEFKGLEELVKAFESAASDEDIAQVNKTIAEKGEPVVQRIMSGKIPKSKDIKKSGRGFGSKSSVSAHAADEIYRESKGERYGSDSRCRMGKEHTGRGRSFLRPFY